MRSVGATCSGPVLDLELSQLSAGMLYITVFVWACIAVHVTITMLMHLAARPLLILRLKITNSRMKV